MSDGAVRVGMGTPGPNDAITDVRGVRVGHTTITRGDGPLRVGEGPVRTGVTIVSPHEGAIWNEPLFAGCDTLNGNGELTGLEWIRESGMLMSPIGLTNTHSVGVVRDALIAAQVSKRPARDLFWSLPVVGETWDGLLNDINGFHVAAEHVHEALDSLSDGPVPQGAVGSGTGMVCHGFKGGIGSSSRVVAEEKGGWTVGVLVQANHGRRERLQVDGVPVGLLIPESEVPAPEVPEGDTAGAGSIITVVATDAPLLPTQLNRLARRASLGIARTGGVGEHMSGDLTVSFSTANRGLEAADLSASPPLTSSVEVLSDAYITPLFDAVVEATEQAIVNALVHAETTVGRDGIVAHGLDIERLEEALRQGPARRPPGTEP